MDNQYDYIIGVQKLNPPVGLYNYMARVVSLTKMGANEVRIEFLEPEIGECIGVTQAEAIEQMEKEVRKWLACNN
ncbi:MAG: hypothetical protein H0X30_21980 [Anaerolineae bacterium]|nr:hypothetical protein [Anaerolineae bacterium]